MSAEYDQKTGVFYVPAYLCNDRVIMAMVEADFDASVEIENSRFKKRAERVSHLKKLVLIKTISLPIELPLCLFLLGFDAFINRLKLQKDIFSYLRGKIGMEFMVSSILKNS